MSNSPQLTLFTPTKSQVEKLPEIMLCFDGGCLLHERNRAYGSYAFIQHGRVLNLQKIHYPENLTVGFAEWQTLADGLESLTRFCDPKETRALVRGDSMIVIEGAAGRWKVRAPHLKPIAAKVKAMADAFAEIRFEWWGRHNSVRIFGH